MPHYKCVTCTIRLMAPGGPPGSCEGCGSVLEPVGGLSEIVGYRLVRPRDDESFAVAVAMALQGVDSVGPDENGDITPTPYGVYAIEDDQLVVDRSVEPQL